MTPTVFTGRARPFIHEKREIFMMQWGAESQTMSNTPVQASGAFGQAAEQPAGLSSQAGLADIKIIRRNGAVVGFEPSKIQVAMTKAFLAVQGNQGAASARVREVTESLTNQVVMALMRRLPAGGTLHIEDIQDQVELALMRSGEHEVARAYVLYRERRSQERAQERAQKQTATEGAAAPALRMMVDGVAQPLNVAWLRDIVAAACTSLGDAVRISMTASLVRKSINPPSFLLVPLLKRTPPMPKSAPVCFCTLFARKSCRQRSRRPRWRVATRTTSPDSSRRASRLAC
jgi:hypothetical protein